MYELFATEWFGNQSNTTRIAGGLRKAPKRGYGFRARARARARERVLMLVFGYDKGNGHGNGNGTKKRARARSRVRSRTHPGTAEPFRIAPAKPVAYRGLVTRQTHFQRLCLR